jgi:hypothetical protein
MVCEALADASNALLSAVHVRVYHRATYLLQCVISAAEHLMCGQQCVLIRVVGLRTVLPNREINQSIMLGCALSSTMFLHC